MAESTSHTLLSRMKVDTGIPWEDFFRKYRDLLRFYGRCAGLDAHEQEELVNDVLFELFHHDRRSLFRYDRTLGKFRSYLKTIAMRRAVDLLRRRADRHEPEDHILAEPAFTEDFCQQEELERRKLLIAEALAELKNHLPPQQYRIFLSCAVEGRKAGDVAADFGLTLSNVYTQKSRAQSLFRQLCQEADELI